MNLTLILAYCLTAVAGGLFAGIFGGGVGLVVIPALVFIFRLEKVPPVMIMHMAVGTGVAAMIVMAVVSVLGHYRHNAVKWGVTRKMLLPMVVGIAMAAILARNLAGPLLIFAFGLIVLLLAIYVLFSQAESAAHAPQYIGIWSMLAGFLIGVIGGLLGVNSFCVPFLKKMGMDIRSAIGSTAVVGAVMAISITVMYIIVGWNRASLPPYSTGFVDWQAALPIAILSIFFVPLGVKLAHWMPPRILKMLYSLLLILIGLKMMIASFIL